MIETTVPVLRHKIRVSQPPIGEFYLDLKKYCPDSRAVLNSETDLMAEKACDELDASLDKFAREHNGHIPGTAPSSTKVKDIHDLLVKIIKRRKSAAKTSKDTSKRLRFANPKYRQSPDLVSEKLYIV